MLLLAAMLGCAPEVEDTGTDTEDNRDTHEKLECDSLEIHVDGEDPPTVGDSWTVVLWCDDVLLTGASRILFTPNDFASVVENQITFLYAGEAEMFMQTGTYSTTRTVTVSEP